MIELFHGDVRTRSVDNGNGLSMRIFEAGDSDGSAPLILLLHGFPELALSWRKILGPLSSAGFHVVAPDQRGYGQTTGADTGYDGDVTSFGMFNLTRDVVGLVDALGYRRVHTVIGHDFGSSVAGFCALIRPDIFQSVVCMSAPFTGAPGFSHQSSKKNASRTDLVDEQLTKLARPRKHYQRYYSTRDANADMINCPQGLHAFLRAYFHHKSADWEQNKPFRLNEYTADQLALMPTYYIMDDHENMAQTVAPHMPDDDAVAGCDWLTETELAQYSQEFARTGLQGGLNWYRCRFMEEPQAQLRTFAGAVIKSPAMFIAGTSDWGTWQKPGDLEKMQTETCTNWRGTHFVDGAGHWVQQENPADVIPLLEHFVVDEVQ